MSSGEKTLTQSQDHSAGRSWSTSVFLGTVSLSRIFHPYNLGRIYGEDEPFFCNTLGNNGLCRYKKEESLSYIDPLTAGGIHNRI
jgi:hypothetical protein